MLEIDAGGLRLTIEPIAYRREEPGGPYMEWIDTKVIAIASGIRAEGTWSVMPAELRGFLQQLQAMHFACKVGQLAELKGVEPAFSMTLKMLEHGAMAGDWRFQPDIDGAYVAGRCGLDQSYIPSVIQGLEEILQFSGARPAPLRDGGGDH